MTEPKMPKNAPKQDPRQPLTNPALKKAIEDARKQDTPQARSAVVNEMLRATFLVPVQVGIAGKPPKPGRDGQIGRAHV